MFNWITGGLGGLFGYAASAAGSAAGWAWDKVTGGIYTWLAQGLALLIEWVWGVLDSATTPHLTQAWFTNGLIGPIGVLALAVTIALMLASAIQAALAGRPEQIIDAVKEGARVIVASALTVTVIDVLIGITDEASAMVWKTGRADLVVMLDKMTTVAATSGPLSATFIGPLCLLVGFVGLIGLVITLLMRSALIYVAAALAPLVWSSSVLPMFRGSARKLVHLLVALIFSKLAIVITLVVAVKLGVNAGGDPASTSIVNDGASAVGMLLSGFVCFLIAAITPFVLYKLMPTVEGAIVGAGIAGGWGRSVTNAAHTAVMVKSAGASAGASAATRAVAGQAGVAGSAGASGATGGGGGAGGGPSGRNAAATPMPSAGGSQGTRPTPMAPRSTTGSGPAQAVPPAPSTGASRGSSPATATTRPSRAGSTPADRRVEEEEPES